MIVRDLQPADLPAVGLLLRQLGYELSEREIDERVRKVAKAPGHRARVAELDGRVVGLLHVFERPALEKACEAIVQALVVETALCGAGIGAALMHDAEDWARDCGLSTVALYTNVARGAAHAFYEHLGYRRAATSHLMRRHL